MITKEQFKRNLERKKRLELANQMRDAYMKAQLAFEMRCTENSLIDHDDENGSAAWIGVTKQ